jgi:hypothetical protein
MPLIQFRVERADWRAGLEGLILASMARYEYRVTEAADGTFPVELWRSGRDAQCIYKTRGFQTREQAEAWIVPVEVRSGDPPSSPSSRVIYLKPRSSTFNP